MQKNTFKDYEKAIRAKYQIEKEGEYAKNFNPTAQANLRDLCWERFVDNKNEDDLSIFSSFFTFNFEINGTVKKKLRDETDRFKTIASFYLKEEKKTVIMTTQFLDEAEELSDRIAVLSKGNKGLGQPFILLGKLFAEGRVDFIKRKFGTGYNLIIENIDRYLFYLLSPKK